MTGLLTDRVDLLVLKLGPQCLARLTLEYPKTAHPSVFHPRNRVRPHCVMGRNVWHPMNRCIGGEWMTKKDVARC
ncbi:hypothetical protein LCGC14_2956520 [marine sediment metagenome]|uniref:Uncharacterized protein n=1 Tax=marine sediment metagenome TaxID=412755 RepID=A0A0F8XEB0_9ZZZZ